MHTTTAIPSDAGFPAPRNASGEALPVTEISEPPVAPKIQWRRAWRAVRALMDEPERTEMAFEAIAALSGRDWEKRFRRFAADPHGRRLLAERPSLLARLSDRAALRALPDASLGHAYAEFMDAACLTTDGLVEAEDESLAAEHMEGLDAHRTFFSHRVRDMHDLWHVLTGYGRDESGEAANLAFTYAQIPQRGIALILFAIALRPAPDGYSRREWIRYLVRAWQRGRRAQWLPIAPFEQLLERPLEEVRTMLGIQPASEAHPRGIIVFNGSLSASH
jgi:ubiquinone biosynthesis protein COQ4